MLVAACGRGNLTLTFRTVRMFKYQHYNAIRTMKREESDSTSKNAQIEEFLSARYEFRYNIILHRAEYHLRGTNDYTVITDTASTPSDEPWTKKLMCRLRPITCTVSSKVIFHHASILYKLISIVCQQRKQRSKEQYTLLLIV